MRLINADKLRQDVLDWENCYNGYSDTYDKQRIVDAIDDQPTIDAVQVVRCKDCAYSEDVYGGYEHWRFCGHFAVTVVDDRYCSVGMRRDDERVDT